MCVGSSGNKASVTGTFSSNAAQAGLPNADFCYHLWRDDNDKDNDNAYDSYFETVLARRYLKFNW
jgi:hypothetical protein